MGMYKNGEMFTEDQQKKLDKLAEMGWYDVVKILNKAFAESNYTDEFKLKLKRGEVEGVGMEED